MVQLKNYRGNDRMVLPIMGILDNMKYSAYLEELVNDIGGTTVLYKSFNEKYVIIDVLLRDGRVISVDYSIEDLDTCDTKDDVMNELEDSISIYSNIDEYNERKDLEPNYN